MLRYLLMLVATSMLVTVASTASAQRVYYAAHHDYRVVTVAEGLLRPYSMAWLPSGDMLVTEMPGQLRIVRDGLLLPEAVPGVPEVFYTGQGGLFEVIPHPNFSENRWIYLSYAKEEGDT